MASGTAIVAVNTMRVGAPQAEAIWALYAPLFAQFAQGVRGQQAAEAVDLVMRQHPPIALLRLSPEQRPALRENGTIQAMETAQGHVGRRVWLKQLLRYAYDLDRQFPQNRILEPPDLEDVRYDFIDTLPQDGRAVLRQALKDQFGLVVRRELRDNLVLTVKTSASGLHKHTPADDAKPGQYRAVNMSMADVANRLNKLLGVTVTDHTGLAGGFDFTLNLPRAASPKQIKRAVLDQLGLELTPAKDSQPVEFLVVEKTHPS